MDDIRTIDGGTTFFNVGEKLVGIMKELKERIEEDTTCPLAKTFICWQVAKGIIEGYQVIFCSRDQKCLEEEVK